MMIPRRLGVVNINQKGFTLAELVIAMAITALIGSAVATATYQVVKVNALSTNHQIAVSQVQNAVNSISRDVQQSQQIIPTGPTVIVINDAANNTISFNLITSDTLTVQWIDWNDNATHQVAYTVANGVLQRTITVDSGVPSTIVVANNINVASGNWNTDLTTYTRTLTLQIKAIVGASNPATETRTFQIIPRPAQ
jgi:prepilin-type N-terminal cleavage/methylation domain-containing protein